MNNRTAHQQARLDALAERAKALRDETKALRKEAQSARERQEARDAASRAVDMEADRLLGLVKPRWYVRPR